MYPGGLFLNEKNVVFLIEKNKKKTIKWRTFRFVGPNMAMQLRSEL